MINIQQAAKEHIQGIAKVCSDGYRDTYAKTHEHEYIERIIKEFYNYERIEKELLPSKGWSGWYVALDQEKVVGAACGGEISDDEAELFALYLDPRRRREGIGTMLLDTLTEEQKKKGAKVQWVSVAKNNEKGIPFYQALDFTEQTTIKSYANTDDERYESVRYRREL